jgi:hypothetical protein
MATRYRCSACGNLTRFDVTLSLRLREFQHFKPSPHLADMVVEETKVLERVVERVVCHWCQASGDAIEVIEVVEPTEGEDTA